MRAFLKLLKGVWQMPLPSQLWTAALATVNLIIPLMYLHHLEAQVTLGVYIVNIIAMISLTALLGYSRLVSAGHALWLALIYYFWTLLGDFPPDTLFGIWMRVLMVLNSIALVLDAYSIWLYVRGDRKPLVD